MLDNEPTSTQESPSSDTPTAPPRRRRAASRPAGPPSRPEPVDLSTAPPVESPAPTDAPPAASDQPATSAESAPARTPRKRAAKKAAPAEPAQAPIAVLADPVPVDAVPAAAAAADAPADAPVAAKRPARKRATRKAGAPVPATEEPAAVETPTPDQSTATVEEVVAAPAPTGRRRRGVRNPFQVPQIPGLNESPDAVEPSSVTVPAAVDDENEDEAATDEAATDEAITVNPDDTSAEESSEDSDDDADEDTDGDSDGDSDDSGDDSSDSGDQPRRRRRRRGGRRRRRGSDDSEDGESQSGSSDPAQDGQQDSGAGDSDSDQSDGSDGSAKSTRSRRNNRNSKSDNDDADAKDGSDKDGSDPDGSDNDDNGDPDGASDGSTRRRRRRRRRGEDSNGSDDDPNVVVVNKVREPRGRNRGSGSSEITGIEGSTRVEAKRQRRREGRESGRRRAPVLSEAEFLARRESVQRTMVIRQRPSSPDQSDLTQIAVLEDGVLVEHYVDQDSGQSLIGNVFLGRVQNVLPSMEAAFIDIGKGRNAVIYAGEVDWDSFGAHGDGRRVEQVLKSGQTILVQVTKDPVGAKGARLTNHISLPGRYIVYSPGGHLSGISRKLPENERKRLKDVLSDLIEGNASVIVRTAAEGASEEELVRDVTRLKAQWEDIAKKLKGSAPQQLYAEPDLTVRIVRDLFTEDFAELLIDGNGSPTDAYETINGYVRHVAPHLADRMKRWQDTEHDVFHEYRVDEQIAKALERKVHLPSGGSLIIDRTEAMTVVDVNTGKFTGHAGNLEATVTSNNLEAAEELVRQLRLRDIGGIIVIDFIDMVLPVNRELLLRRLVECLGRDRTRHQVAEVTSLGLVQMTRKRIGTGLLEAFSTDCPHCHGRGVEVHELPIEKQEYTGDDRRGGGNGGGGGGNNGGGNNGGGNGGGGGRGGRRSGRSSNAQTDRARSTGPIPRPPSTGSHHEDEHEHDGDHEHDVDLSPEVDHDAPIEIEYQGQVEQPADLQDQVEQPAELEGQVEQPADLQDQVEHRVETEAVAPAEEPGHQQ